jgi:hypothetical protein
MSPRVAPKARAALTALLLALAAPLAAAAAPQTPASGQDAVEPEDGSAPAEQTPAPDTPAGAAGEPIPFEGGRFTIVETEDLDKVLSYDGQEVARNYVVFFDRIVSLRDANVALFSVGDGGNQCGPATVIAWKQDGELRTETVGEDCGAPPAAATADSLYFVPWLMPGATQSVQVWSPAEGLRTAGLMSFTPQPDTGWDDLDLATLDNVAAAFDNAAVYRQARKLLGDDLQDFATGLMTGGGVELTSSGIAFGYGCVPHACGSADSFMAIDAAGRRLYLAQQTEGSRPRSWPPLKQWPDDVRAAMQAAIGRAQ